MMSVQLLFTRRRTIGSALIRLLSGSTWSHVDLIDPDDDRYVIGATGKKGVHRDQLSTRLAASSKAAIMTLPNVDTGQLKAHVIAHIGESYDWPGVMHFILPWRKQDPDRMFCSELIAHALKLAQVDMGGLDPAHTTPGDLWDGCCDLILRPMITWLL